MFAQGVAQHLQPLLLRGLTTSTASAAAVPALASKSSGGLASLFGFGGSARLDVPLSEALPSVPQPLRSSVPAAAPKLQTSVLDAGTKVATIDSISPVSTIALIVPGGSSFETDRTAGASKVLESMAFKSTTNRTTFRLTRELEKIGAVAYANAGRDHISFAVDTVKLHTPEATEMLLDAVLNPRFTHWEVEETLETVKRSLGGLLKQPINILTEVLHRAAYDGTLGQPLIVDPTLLEHFDRETLAEYTASIIDPSKIVLAGVGVDHAEFTQLANPLMSSGQGSAATSARASGSYVGGTANVIHTSPLTHVALAFEAKGGLSDAKTAALAAVVEALLDEARAPLPWTRKESDVFRSIGSFTHMYKDTGLVGIVASALPHQGKQLVDAVCKRIEALAKGVSDVQLQQAKQVAIGSYKEQLGTTSGAVGLLAPHVLLAGKFDAADLVSKVNGLSTSDVVSFVGRMIKSPSSFVTFGSLSHMPRVDIAKRFS